MKPIKMLGLAALAALLAMAFVGASSAMASTQLCKEDAAAGACANALTHVHEATVSGAKAKLLTSVATVECDALFLGDSLGLAATLIIHGHFTYTNCKRGTENCTAEEKSTDSLLEVTGTGHETAKVEGSGEVNVHCGFVINCTYNGEELIGTATGPLLGSSTTGETTLSEQTTKHTAGAFCPATGKLDIRTVSLEAAYLNS